MTGSEDKFRLGFAQNLARLMEAQGSSVAAVAEASGLKPSRIERLIAAKAEPGAIEIMRLAKALRVTPGDLIDDIVRGLDSEA
jgi:transcriptional regulator with XRE-family HTH domain